MILALPAPIWYMLLFMKYLRIFGWMACAGLLVSCESMDTADHSSGAEQRALARKQAAQAAEAAHTSQDEATQNLWNAQHNVVNRDGNPMRGN